MDCSKWTKTSWEFLSVYQSHSLKQRETCVIEQRSQSQHSFLCMSGSSPGTGTVGRGEHRIQLWWIQLPGSVGGCSSLPHSLAFLCLPFPNPQVTSSTEPGPFVTLTDSSPEDRRKWALLLILIRVPNLMILHVDKQRWGPWPVLSVVSPGTDETHIPNDWHKLP